MSGSRVLLSGASGFVGSHALSYLLEKTDWTFVCPASFRHRGNPLRIKPSDRVEVPTLDLTGVIPNLGDFDYILHLASESHVTRSIQDPVPFVENNVSITLQMLEYAKKHPPEKFIQFSTDEAFGDAETSGELLNPSNPYAASKAAQEMLAKAWLRTYGVPTITTNSNNIIGSGQDEEKFVPMVAKAVKEDREVTLHKNDGRYGSRYYNHASNVAAALLFILEKGEVGERYNIPGGVKKDNLEMATAIAELLGKRLQYRDVYAGEDRPGYDQSYAEPDSKLTKMGLIPPASFTDGLKEAIGE